MCIRDSVNIDANIVDKYLNLSADMAYRQEDRNSIAGSTSDVFKMCIRDREIRDKYKRGFF